MKRKPLLYLLFFALLFLIFFYVLTKVIPGFASPTTPPISYVQPFSFFDQDGNRFTDKDVSGKVFVAEYFFTTCKGICPKMNENMKTIFERFKNESDFAILSHTSMPETDSVPLMKAYEERMLGKNPAFDAKWYFVTGTKDSLYKMAQGYLLDNDKNNSINVKDHFIHTQFFSLVDKQRRVRGIYDGLRHDELERLQKDIQKLLKEPVDKGGFNHSPFNNNPA